MTCEELSHYLVICQFYGHWLTGIVCLSGNKLVFRSDDSTDPQNVGPYITG